MNSDLPVNCCAERLICKLLGMSEGTPRSHEPKVTKTGLINPGRLMALLFASGHRGPAVDTLNTIRADSRIFLSFPIKRLCLP
jgi:hypothetical protein